MRPSDVRSARSGLPPRVARARESRRARRSKLVGRTVLVDAGDERADRPRCVIVVRSTSPRRGCSARRGFQGSVSAETRASPRPQSSRSKMLVRSSGQVGEPFDPDALAADLVEDWSCVGLLRVLAPPHRGQTRCAARSDTDGHVEPRAQHACLRPVSVKCPSTSTSFPRGRARDSSSIDGVRKREQQDGERGHGSVGVRRRGAAFGGAPRRARSSSAARRGSITDRRNALV